MKNLVHVSCCKSARLALAQRPGSAIGLVIAYANVCFYKVMPNCLPKWLPIYTSTNTIVPVGPLPVRHLVLSDFLTFANPGKCKMESHCDFV